MGKSKDNGLRILHEAHVLTTPFEVEPSVMASAVQCLVEQKVATEAVVLEAQKTVPQYQLTPVNLTQVVLLASETPTVGEAFEKFIRSKLSVFKKDYTEMPNPEMLNHILNWATGSSQQPPELYAHLLAKRDGLYFIQDRDFITFLNVYFDSKQQKIVLPAGNNNLPVCDIMMFAPLIPLGQNQQDQKMNETKFEQTAQALAEKFDLDQWENFANYLVNGPDRDKKGDPKVNPNCNYTYPKKYPTPRTDLEQWVVVMRLLRNIFSHQRDPNWGGLAVAKAKILAYMKSAANFQLLVKCYQDCLL